MSDVGPSLSREMMQPTRQQLDDLDALIAQMLTLPVSPAPEEMTADSAALVSSVPHAENLELAADLPLSMGAAGMEAFLSAHALPSGEGSGVRSQESGVRSQGSELADEGAAQEMLASRPSSLIPRPSLVIRPLVWLDRGFVACTAPLGGLGRWLQAADGRTVLGLTGLALLCTALAWGIMDWIRWSP